MADPASRQTRSATGNSKPRVFPVIEAPAVAKKSRKGTKKGGASGTKANTSKPRVKKTATGRVSKPSTKKTTTKKGPASKVAEKVNGAVEKVEGAVEKKPGKKVGPYFDWSQWDRLCFDSVSG
jgi:hypothetical protein